MNETLEFILSGQWDDAYDEVSEVQYQFHHPRDFTGYLTDIFKGLPKKGRSVRFAQFAVELLLEQLDDYGEQSCVEWTTHYLPAMVSLHELLDDQFDELKVVD